MAPSANQKYIVDEEGNPTAVILPIKDYKKMLAVLDEVEDHREPKFSLNPRNLRNWSKGDWRISGQVESHHGRKSGMTYDVQLTETFRKSVRILKKKYPHIKVDLLGQIKALEEDPSAGDPISPGSLLQRRKGGNH